MSNEKYEKYDIEFANTGIIFTVLAFNVFEAGLEALLQMRETIPEVKMKDIVRIDKREK